MFLYYRIVILSCKHIFPWGDVSSMGFGHNVAHLSQLGFYVNIEGVSVPGLITCASVVLLPRYRAESEGSARQ